MYIQKDDERKKIRPPRFIPITNEIEPFSRKRAYAFVTLTG